MEADITSQAVGLASSADFSILNLFQRLIPPSKRIYRYYSKSQKNIFSAPTKRQLERFIYTIETRSSREYFNNIDKLCLKTKGSIILDVGTNIGYWSYAFAQSKDPKREVIGFEPDLRNLSMAASNLSKQRGISILNMGLSDEPGRFSVSIPSEGKKVKCSQCGEIWKTNRDDEISSLSGLWLFWIITILLTSTIIYIGLIIVYGNKIPIPQILINILIDIGIPIEGGNLFGRNFSR